MLNLLPHGVHYYPALSCSLVHLQEVYVKQVSVTTYVRFDDGLSRRSVLSTFASAAAATYSSPAWAGYAGEGASLGLKTVKPKDAEKDDELLATKEVKKANTLLTSQHILGGISFPPIVSACSNTFVF